MVFLLCHYRQRLTVKFVDAVLSRRGLLFVLNPVHDLLETERVCVRLGYRHLFVLQIRTLRLGRCRVDSFLYSFGGRAIRIDFGDVRGD